LTGKLKKITATKHIFAISEERAKLNFFTNYLFTGNYKKEVEEIDPSKSYQRIYHYKIPDNKESNLFFKLILPKFTAANIDYMPTSQVFDYLTIFETKYFLNLRLKNSNERLITIRYDRFVDQMKALYADMPYHEHITRIREKLKILEEVKYDTNAIFLRKNGKEFKKRLQFSIIEKGSFKILKQNGMKYIQFIWNKTYFDYVMGNALDVDKYRTFDSSDIYKEGSTSNSRKIALFIKTLGYSGQFQYNLSNIYNRFFVNPSYSSSDSEFNFEHYTYSEPQLAKYLNKFISHYNVVSPGISIENRTQAGKTLNSRKLVSPKRYSKADLANVKHYLNHFNVSHSEAVNIFQSLLPHMAGHQIFLFVKTTFALFGRKQPNDFSIEAKEAFFKALLLEDNIVAFKTHCQSNEVLYLATRDDFNNVLDDIDSLSITRLVRNSTNAYNQQVNLFQYELSMIEEQGSAKDLALRDKVVKFAQQTLDFPLNTPVQDFSSFIASLSLYL
jgi:hypothetical protein